MNVGEQELTLVNANEQLAGLSRWLPHLLDALQVIGTVVLSPIEVQGHGCFKWQNKQSKKQARGRRQTAVMKWWKFLGRQQCSASTEVVLSVHIHAPLLVSSCFLWQ